MSLVLASASARRRDLLAAAGIGFIVDPANADERPRPGEAPRDYALRVAKDKVRLTRPRHPAAAVLAADTIVVVDGDILGKPASPDEARRMLARLSGRAHEVVTAVALAWPGGERAFLETTEVRFHAIETSAIEHYVATGEPLDKAGAYAIQGGASAFVAAISGSHSNVVGLPVEATMALLREAGVG